MGPCFSAPGLRRPALSPSEGESGERVARRWLTASLEVQCMRRLGHLPRTRVPGPQSVTERNATADSRLCPGLGVCWVHPRYEEKRMNATVRHRTAHTPRIGLRLALATVVALAGSVVWPTVQLAVIVLGGAFFTFVADQPLRLAYAAFCLAHLALAPALSFIAIVRGQALDAGKRSLFLAIAGSVCAAWSLPLGLNGWPGLSVALAGLGLLVAAQLGGASRRGLALGLLVGFAPYIILVTLVRAAMGYGVKGGF